MLLLEGRPRASVCASSRRGKGPQHLTKFKALLARALRGSAASRAPLRRPPRSSGAAAAVQARLGAERLLAGAGVGSAGVVVQRRNGLFRVVAGTNGCAATSHRWNRQQHGGRRADPHRVVTRACGPSKPPLVGRLPRGLLASNSPPLGLLRRRDGRDVGGIVEVRVDVFPARHTVGSGAAAPIVPLRSPLSGCASGASLELTGVCLNVLIMSTGVSVLDLRRSASLPEHCDELSSADWAPPHNRWATGPPVGFVRRLNIVGGGGVVRTSLVLPSRLVCVARRPR